MPRAADHDRIRLAVQTGVPPRLIASRLGVSLRTVARAAGSLRYDVNELVGTPDEHALWQLYHTTWGESIAHVARRFCVSRQAVWKALEQAYEWVD
jgi:predicted DNA-binding protein (UPF0251 family)